MPVGTTGTFAVGLSMRIGSDATCRTPVEASAGRAGAVRRLGSRRVAPVATEVAGPEGTPASGRGAAADEAARVAAGMAPFRWAAATARRSAADRVRRYPAAYTVRMAAELNATKLFAIFLFGPLALIGATPRIINSLLAVAPALLSYGNRSASIE